MTPWYENFSFQKKVGSLQICLLVRITLNASCSVAGWIYGLGWTNVLYHKMFICDLSRVTDYIQVQQSWEARAERLMWNVNDHLSFLHFVLLDSPFVGVQF